MSPVEFNEISSRLVSDTVRDLRLTPAQASGVVGSSAHETGGFQFMQELRPVVQGSQGGYGFAQWTGGRRDNFEKWAKERGLDINSYEANYGFMRHEIETVPFERRRFDEVRNATTPGEAAKVFTERWLRPDKDHVRMGDRVNWTNRIVNEVVPTISFEPRVAPTPATPSLPLQSALLARGATDQALQSALNARVNAPPMPRPRPQQSQSPLGAIDAAAPRQPSPAMAYLGPFAPRQQAQQDLTQPGAVQRSVQAASQSQNPALQAALSARVSGRGRHGRQCLRAMQARTAPSQPAARLPRPCRHR
ncbi:phage tail tip lysozyme [Devosia sp. A8/3-2]|nr:phage tail tip lysozyme [Devosia sp. A8/3-2]